MVNAYYLLSRFYWNKDADSALLLGQQGLAIATPIHFEKGMALCYLTMGVAYGTKAMYPQALDCHLKALRLSEKLGMEGLSGNNYTNIGIVYTGMKDYLHALDYFHRSLEVARHFNARDGIAYAFINIGDVYTRMNDFDSAIAYNKNALQIGEKIHDSSILSPSLLSLGENYTRKDQPQAALAYLQRALRISEDMHDEDGLAWTHVAMADAYHQSGQYKESIRHAETGLHKGEALHADECVKKSYHILYTDYQGLGDFKHALLYRDREIALNDSLYTLEKERQIKALQSDYELEKKQLQIDLLNKDKLLQQAETAKDKIRNYVLIVGTVLLGLWAFLLARSNAQKKRLNRLLKNRNQEIGKQNKQLGDLNAVKNKLLSIIGHDLRSPIGTLKGFVDLLKQSSLSPEQIHYFSGKMSESLEGTSHLLDNLLFWAKSQMEGMQVNARSFDLRSVIGQNQRLAQDRADEKKVTLLTDEAVSPVIVYADEVMVDMVIRNLVENAIKFSRAGDSVSLSAVTGKEDVLITIEDTGQGIPAESQHIIFNSISYTTAGTSREKGSGLGLSLCKELVEKNGGKIWFESQPGKGTAFRFTLPVARNFR